MGSIGAKVTWRAAAALGCLLALAGVLMASEVAAGAKQSAQSSARPYKLSVEFTGKNAFKGWGRAPAPPEGGEGARFQSGAEGAVTTYRARSKRPFYMRLSYRGDCRRGGCLGFRAPLSGSLSHRGSGWELTYAAHYPPYTNLDRATGGFGPSRLIDRWCMANSSEWYESPVRGSADFYGPPGAFSVGIDVEEDLSHPARGDAKTSYTRLGTDPWPPWDGTCLAPITTNITAGQLIMAPSKVWTDPIDLRRKFGQAFTIGYPDPPGALPDKPNRVALEPGGSGQPTLTDTYEFNWTLRFTPVPKRKQR